jgi:hypothetical protein
VAWRSGRRVAIVTLRPGETVTDPDGVSTGIAEPDLRRTVVEFGPIATVNVRPCQCRLFKVTP